MLGDLRVLTGEEIAQALTGQEEAIIETVKTSYLETALGAAVVPHSSFLQFHDGTPDRIIALPAYVKRPVETAGIKWISSVPSNVDRGLDRASGLIIINERATGRAIAVLEGSVISAKRTGASAAVAARALCDEAQSIDTVGLIGLGCINYELLRFLKVAFPSVRRVQAYDQNTFRTGQFANKCAQGFPDLQVESLASAGDVLRSCHLISIATTAAQPHIDTLVGVPNEAVILHISLRDLSVDAILSANNVVDDADHVCRAQTSVHLASERVGHRRFLTNLSEVILDSRARRTTSAPTVFSPFGLGCLDVAVAAMVLTTSENQGVGTVIRSFHPPSWLDR